MVHSSDYHKVYSRCVCQDGTVDLPVQNFRTGFVENSPNDTTQSLRLPICITVRTFEHSPRRLCMYGYTTSSKYLVPGVCMCVYVCVRVCTCVYHSRV